MVPFYYWDDFRSSPHVCKRVINFTSGIIYIIRTFYPTGFQFQSLMNFSFDMHATHHTGLRRERNFNSPLTGSSRKESPIQFIKLFSNYQGAFSADVKKDRQCCRLFSGFSMRRIAGKVPIVKVSKATRFKLVICPKPF